MRIRAKVRRSTMMLVFAAVLLSQVVFGGFINVNVAQAAVNVDYGTANKIDLSTKGLDFDMQWITYDQFIGLPGGKIGILGYTALGHSYSVIDSNGSVVFDLPLNTNEIMGVRALDYSEIYASPMANGNTVIMWNGQQGGCDMNSGHSIQFIIVDALGNVVQPATDISTATADYNCYSYAQPLSDGNIAFMYQVTGAEYYYRIFDTTTAAFLAAPVSVEGAGANDSTSTHVIAASSNGTFMIAYHTHNATQYHVAVYRNDGKRINAFDYATEDILGNGHKSLAALSNGNYALLVNTPSGFQLQIMDSIGNPVGPPITSGLKYTTADPAVQIDEPGVLGLGDGGFLVLDNAYQNVAPDYPGQLYVKQFNNDGTPYNNNSSWLATGVEGSVHTYGWAFAGYDRGFGYINWIDFMLHTYGMEIPVASVSLDQSSLDLLVGGATATLTASVLPSNATNKAVIWSSDDAGIASVANGIVTPVGAGSTFIRATTIDGAKVAMAAVTVGIPITGITLDQPALTFETGDSAVTLTPTITPSNASNKTLMWATSNSGVATVDVSGVVTPVGPGTAMISAVAADGSMKMAAATVTVIARVTGVTLDQSTMSLNTGGAAGALTATVSPANATNKNVTWSSDNTDVATVANGIITPVGAGTANITVTTADGAKKATAAITVTTRVSGVTLDKTSLNLYTGGANGVLVATVNPSDASNKDVTWSSDNSSVATVSNGIVTPVSAGVAHITVMTADGMKTDTATVTVTTKVSGIMLDQPTMSLYTGGPTGTLVATVAPSNASDKTVIWTSDNTSVATVVNGVVTPVAVGKAHITAKTADGNFTATSTVTVTTKVISVTLDKPTLQLFTGGAEGTLIATVNPSNATNQNVTWSSDDEDVATVVDGVVTPVKAGTAHITVTTVDGGYTATSTVTVTTQVTGVTLDQPTMHLYTGGSNGTLVAAVKPTNATNKNVTWSSDQSSVATVVDGVVTPVSAGTAHITVTTVDGNYSATSTVTVTTAVTGVALDKPTMQLFTGGASGTLAATVSPSKATNKDVTWSSDNTSVATVDDGVVTPVRAGTAHITVTTVDGSFTATSTITVTTLVTGVALDQPTMHLFTGGSNGTLVATIAPAAASNKDVTWTSDNASVATVADGVVTPVSAGTAYITVKTVDGNFAATSTVTVTTPVTGVALDQPTMHLFTGGANGTLAATVSPSNATNKNVTWSSDNTSVATVADGVVTPVSAGTAHITVTTEDGSFTAASTVTVTTSVTGIALDQPTMHLYTGGSNGTLVATIAPANATNKGVTWSSDNTNVATVANGVVTPVGVGTAHITVKTVDGDYTATSTITVTTAATGVTLDQPTMHLFTGGANGTLVATVAPSNATNKNVTWSSDNTSVATVVTGVVTPVSAGTAHITVTTADGSFTAISTITVTTPVTGVTLDHAALHLFKGGADGTLTPVFAPANATNKKVTWSSDDTSVATVVDGVVTPVGAGTAHITVTTEDGGYTATSTITVTTPVTGVKLDRTTLGLTLGGSADTLKATITPADATNSNLTWSSSDPTVATVADGVITPAAVGTTTITVTTADGGFTATSQVTVSYPYYPPADNGSDEFEVLVNGKPESAGKITKKEQDGRTVTTVTVDPDKLDKRLASEGQGAVVTIPVPEMSDKLIIELTADMIRGLDEKEAVIVIKTDRGTYTIPADQINIGAISDQLGSAIGLKDIKIQIQLSVPADDMMDVVDNTAEKGSFKVVVPPLDFTILGVYGDRTIKISKFNVYVERLLAIPDDVDPSKVTTGVVIEPDGTFRQVPTKVFAIDGHYYAAINSLTNSTYALVSHPVTFSDVANHWSKNAVNDMGSRLIIEGVGNGLFQPNRDITRAEFAAIIVRALGLELKSGKAPFSDVNESAWYNQVIHTAYQYDLIDGFEDGTFHPSDLITREQAMVIIAKAMKLTGLKAKLPSQSTDVTLEPFEDASSAAKWALEGIADSVQAGIVTGRNGSELAPKDNITRAEVAAIIQRLLQKSDLISLV
ncbi:hypothetical protein PCCS19_23930 [Paenibacillus sp. CCS19]|uniref:Ig-like domain-containing protein n=1 Tax=Paenibacillus sp. CCS19 TaxID=3158387 RepID=UPI00256B6095|nr:Ig-like domain-containing protein [Paenibacillus cellulosilyticus]GMK39339.1 hypothetical protein PCCS19_23930 [Paenibacillus cellulosilyticus]